MSGGSGNPVSHSLETRGKIAVLCSGAAWGVFWIPLRALEDTGLHGLWVTFVYFLMPCCLMLPVLVWRWRSIWAGGLNFQLTVIASGAALTLYSISILYTDVVRALLLFYLMPIWSLLLARLFLGELITPLRVAAMGLSVVGMLTIFGLGVSFPIPRNAGDWMGLASGFFWAIAMVRMRLFDSHSSLDLTVGFFIWGLLISGGIAVCFAPTVFPDISLAFPIVPMLLLFVVFLVIPGTYASLWGPKFVNPGVVGLLFMTELVVGVISAAILTGEQFGQREVIGILMIACASLLEPVTVFFKRSRAQQRRV